MELQQILDKINAALPPQPVLSFSLERRETGLFDCKIGGTPYFPKSMEYPRGKNGSFAGQPLTLLAQLNFERLPHIPDFPEKGILQLFIAGDDMYGMSCGNAEKQTSQDNFRVIYHRDIITDETKLLAPGDVPKYTGGDELLPFTGEYLLAPESPALMPVTFCDHRFSGEFVRHYNQTADKPVSHIWEIDGGLLDRLYDDPPATPDAYIGGYPVFTQEDPRAYNESVCDCDTVLFMLDSPCDAEKNIDICWGDAGTGCFLIPRSRLKALDFSRVLYNFDCS